MARPLKEVDEKQVYELASMSCTMSEIAAVCDCSVDTLERRFREVIDKGRESGKMSLKRAQFKAALSGNIPMLIWLGKCVLGQMEVRPEDINQIKEILIKIDSNRIVEHKAA